ncbi:hypothetical protein BS47DRAFT_1370625 [Hydnum rufescens UP504]|uniref:Uncharacterized protein n=1 Tax=Hydnum rufescens UP504 TaxID=1448309 RepID=A0A9P6B9F6_9AGAM|nr:hypothetical protein BS47DRAFT_1370625 [Hydnum rufescens UP504]
MSLSPNPDSGYHRPSGKTPPPAPSAAYAKRAREIQAEEGLAGRYRPPPLRGSQVLSDVAPYDKNNMIRPPGPNDEPSPAPSNNPAGFRRARAGTLPSNVHLAAQSYASTINTPSGFPSSIVSSELTTESPPAPSPVSNTNVSIARPSLRHATSAATTAVLATEKNSRLRSGSLTLPTGGLGDAFGPSIFSSSWLPGSAQRNTASNSPFPILDELRSITSGDSQAGEEYDVHTLDYLGLDDGPARGPPPATISELRNQTQAAIVGSLSNPSRHRANTVANPYQRTRSTRTPGVHTLETPEDAEYEYQDYQNRSVAASYTRQRMDSYESSTPGSGSGYGSNQDNQYIARGFKQSDHLGPGPSVRSRASSVGNVDDSDRLRRVAIEDPQGAYSSFPQGFEQSGNNQPSMHGLGSTTTPTAGSLLRSLHIETNVPHPIIGQSTTTRTPAASSPSVRFPSAGDLSVGSGTNGVRGQLGVPQAHSRDSRAVSPKEIPGTQLQTPSRSLWIGNLDSGVSGEDLARAFAPYGAIESFRLLPEKECGFVNFVDITDAMRAKDDVLNRLGGSIGMANGQTVRIGFGKADSAPVTPSGPNSGGTHSSHFLTTGSVASTPNGTGGLNSPGAGMDAQLQSSPTRALWIGSIPSTTTPATILSVFSPFGPIESARVLTHKNCGFVNFERLDDAVRARKALNGRDVLGSDVGAIRIGFARVPVKNGGANGEGDESTASGIQGVGDLSVGATIHALRGVKGATAVPTDQQVLGGAVENYRSNLLLSMIGSGTNPSTLIMKLLSDGTPDAEVDVQALSEFRPPTAYYSSIPLAAERAHNRRWDASKLRELRKRLDSGSCTVEEIDDVAADFLDGEIVDLASDWLGNTVVQKLFERCSPSPRYAMLERIAPHLAMIGIHKNGTWAAQKVIECASTPEEIALIAINLRPYAPPLLLDQFGNYVVQCCLRFGTPANDFIFDAMTDRLWEIAQGRFGARSMRACLESPYITLSQQRRIATAVILNSIPLATNPNGALLLTWLLDTSGFHSRYRLLAPRFTPHLSHLCTHKLASLTVLRIVNQKTEPEASQQIVQALFFSTGDHVLTDVLGDQINGVAVVHKILQSPYLDPAQRPTYLEATKRVLVDLKVTSAQAYRRLIEEVGLPLPSFATSFGTVNGATGSSKKASSGGPHSAFTAQNSNYGGYNSDMVNSEPSLASVIASAQALQLQGPTLVNGVGPSHNGLSQGGPSLSNGLPQLHVNPSYGQNIPPGQQLPTSTFSPSSDPFNPFSIRSPELASSHSIHNQYSRRGINLPSTTPPSQGQNLPLQGMFGAGGGGGPTSSQTLAQTSNGMMNMSMDQQVRSSFSMAPSQIHPQLYQAYMYQVFQQQHNAAQNGGGFHV